MRAGVYRHHVTIDSTPVYVDTDGGVVESPAVAFGARWANIRPLRGSEAYRFNQLQASVDSVIELRTYLDGVTPKMHVTLGARRWEIVAVLQDEGKRRYTDLVCRELV